MFRRVAPLVAALAVVLSACSGSAAGPALTDPKEILTKSVEALQGVKTVHLKADVTGKVNIDLTGQGGGALDLTGTTLEGDVDMSADKAHFTMSAPALMGTGADVIVADGSTYTKITGPFSQGDKYQKQAATPGGSSTTPTDPTKAIADLKAGLDKLTTPPTKGADEKCGDADCYHVTLKVSSSDLGDLASAAPGVSGDATVDVLSRKDNLRPTTVTILVNAGAQGSVTVTLTLSNYDAAVTIQAPPADQIQG